MFNAPFCFITLIFRLYGEPVVKKNYQNELFSSFDAICKIYITYSYRSNISLCRQIIFRRGCQGRQSTNNCV